MKKKSFACSILRHNDGGELILLLLFSFHLLCLFSFFFFRRLLESMPLHLILLHFRSNSLSSEASESKKHQKRNKQRVLSLSEYLGYMSAALRNSTEFFLNIVNGNFSIVSGPKFRKYSNLLFPVIIIAYII